MFGRAMGPPPPRPSEEIEDSLRAELFPRGWAKLQATSLGSGDGDAEILVHGLNSHGVRVDDSDDDEDISSDQSLSTVRAPSTTQGTAANAVGLLISLLAKFSAPRVLDETLCRALDELAEELQLLPER